MFSVRTRGTDGFSYDSKAEARVAQSLDYLIKTGVIFSYFSHPIIAGLNIDFMVHMGPESNNVGKVILLEYDGLTLQRTKGLEKRILRLSELKKYGIDLRWITETSEEHVKNALIDYSLPKFIYKVNICPICGKENKKLLITKRKKDKSQKEIITQKPCNTHGKNNDTSD